MNAKDKKAMKQMEIELSQADINAESALICRSTERFKKFIELAAPMTLIHRESQMIQYRALHLESLVEFDRHLREKKAKQE